MDKMKGNQHHSVLSSMVKLYRHLYIGIMLRIEITFDKQLMVWLQKMYCFCLAELLVHFEYKFSGTCTSCSMLSICSHLVYAPPF